MSVSYFKSDGTIGFKNDKPGLGGKSFNLKLDRNHWGASPQLITQRTVHDIYIQQYDLLLREDPFQLFAVKDLTGNTVDIKNYFERLYKDVIAPFLATGGPDKITRFLHYWWRGEFSQYLRVGLREHPVPIRGVKTQSLLSAFLNMRVDSANSHLSLSRKLIYQKSTARGYIITELFFRYMFHQIDRGKIEHLTLSDFEFDAEATYKGFIALTSKEFLTVEKTINAEFERIQNKEHGKSKTKKA